VVVEPLLAAVVAVVLPLLAVVEVAEPLLAVVEAEP
jgi:hypothetical protein